MQLHSKLRLKFTEIFVLKKYFFVAMCAVILIFFFFFTKVNKLVCLCYGIRYVFL